MANHINHYKSLKKNNTKSKREEIPIYPSTLFALLFCSLFFIFLLLVFLQWFHFLLSSPSFLGLWCCLLLLPSFEFHTKTIFFPISFIFHFCPDIFSTDLYVCYIFIHISPFAVAISFMRCFHFFLLFSLSLSSSVCSMNTVHSSHNRSYGYKRVHVIHVMTFVQNISTVLYWNRQKLDLMVLLQL